MSTDTTVETTRQWIDLSLAQRAVWLDAKLSQSSDYLLGGWVRVHTPLDIELAHQVISLVMARHDALRLRVDDELPRQWLDESVEPPVTIQVLPDTADAQSAFESFLEERFRETLPLGDHPLFSVDVLRAGDRTTYLLWRFHHLIADGASVAITLYHFANAYEALTSLTPKELAPPSSYLKVITSDSAYLESAAYQKDLAYWSKRFDPLPHPLIGDLETRATTGTQAPAAVWKFEGSAFADFQNAAKSAGANVQRSLFALFAAVLGRRWGQTDVVSGVALHRRDLSNLLTVGMIAGVIPVRCQFEPFWTLDECVQAFSEQMDRDLRHQRMPIDVLSRALGLAGSGRAGLFEAAMSFIPAEKMRGDAGAAGLGMVLGQVPTKEASPVSLHAHEFTEGDGLTITIAVNPSFLPEAECYALLDLLKDCVKRFTEQPEARFEDLSTLTPDEFNLVVNRWNDSAAPFETGTLDALFSAQAQRTPNATAIVGRDGVTVSYAELDARSTKLARTLVSHGVKPERVVGVRMERSADTIIALLAILKAGGVYLPLDPAYPEERLEYMKYDAGALLVLEALDSLTGDAELPVLTDPRRLAYIIYTSGTTGVPKGVEVSHTAPVNLAFARRACHDPIGEGDRVLAGISVGFDVSIGQLLLPLLSGATVVIAPDLKSLGSSEFWQLLARERVTHINSVPSFFESILEDAPPSGSLALKRLMLGGEALSGALVDRIQRKLSGVEIVNMYGPTEACIDATYHVASSADLTSAVLPIGQPLSNYRAYILNEMLEPVGVGVSGELYLGGAGLARGYVNAASLTGERFIANPFADPNGAGGERLYRTGDRARWRPDGRIEFLGRADQQIKIRGFRVEPGEIASVLAEYAGINQAVVVPRPQPAGLLRLIAYFVPRDTGAVPETADLRRFLADRLPDYMVPSAFVSIAAIPLNRNGKLDEKALPAPDLRDAGHIAPRTPNEELVAQLFAETLGLERCGATDHFFELGGHSLLATSLISKLRNAGVVLPLRAVFEAPTVESLALRLDATAGRYSASEAITAAPRPAEIPLSFPQERIWFVDRLQQDAGYNNPVALELSGVLNLDALHRALTRMVARHESLRTRIILNGGRPAQDILPPPAAFPLEYLDLSMQPAAEREAALRNSLTQFAAHRFDLAAAAPLAIRLIALDAQRHVLALLVHHVAFDGWSANLFLREFAAIYNAFAANSPDPLPPLNLQYADFAIWQRKQDRQSDLAFWLDHLKDAPPQSNLPADFPAPAQRPVQSTHIYLNADLHRALELLAREQGASLFMVLHAAFALLLSRWSGQDDVVIGTVVANRNRAEWEEIIGCFINTLALRTTFASGESFVNLLNRVKESDLAAFAHQDLPFEQLVEALQPERSLETTPVFQTMLILQNAPAPVGELSGLKVAPVPTEVQVPRFDLSVTLEEAGGALRGTFEFATKRFAPETIERFAGQYLRLLENIVQNPSRIASEIQAINPAELAKVLHHWSGETRQFPSNTLDALFAEQVGVHPSALALIAADGRELTYAELDARSSALARYLVSQGVGPERVVGVRMERSAETVIALLGILKAGGVYLPLDPAYPADRLDYIAQDAAAHLILTSIDQLDGETDPTPSTDPNRLAYIIYTSGTTGLPKGAAVSHVPPVNLAFARRACHDPIGVGDRVLAAISVGFDVSIGQLLLPLLSGATVVIAGDLKTMSPGEFWSFIDQRRVTHINSVPSFFDSILDAAPAAGSLALKRLMLGGEALSGPLVARIQRAIPGIEVVNMYGPTEACIDATYHIATPADLSAAVLPIGRPLSNYSAYVLDPKLQPLGIGVPGELYLGGTGLARGYVNSPELTAERFVQHPFVAAPGVKLYRTGDLARWRADGVLEFLGRVDQQVKIRGFRVEPGEIAAQLLRQDGVREAAVVPYEAPGGTRLVAYYSSADSVTVDALRAALAAKLPDYMVPAAFVKIDSLPLTPNGKLDRKALPPPGKTDFAARIYEPPVGETEEKIAALWCDLLKLPQVGRHDNFFELGGHSLLAMTLVDRLHQQGLATDVRTLFTNPTVAGLAEACSSATPQQEAPPNLIAPGTQRITPEMLPLVRLSQTEIDNIAGVVPGGHSNIQDIYPLAPLQEGILFQHLVSQAGDPYLIPFLLALDTRERLDSFIDALGRMAARHDVLRTAIVSQGVGTPVQVVLRQVDLPVEEVSLNPAQSGKDAAAELLDRFNPQTYKLDLSRAPFLRAAFAHDPANNRWLLLMVTHHLVVDNTSMGLMVAELRALMAGVEAALPTPIPYRNFIAQTLHGVSSEEHRQFFEGMLADVDEPTAPFGLLDTQVNVAEVEEKSVRLNPELSRQIREISRQLGISPAALFHLAWASVVGFTSGKSDVVFGTVLLGRMRSGAGADRAMGMFINTLPIRFSLDETGVRQAALDAQAHLANLLVHEHAPLAIAQRASAIPPPAPLFSSVFNFRNSPEERNQVAWPGVSLLHSFQGTNYPLSVAVDDTGSGFAFQVLAHRVGGAGRVSSYFLSAITHLVDLLEKQSDAPVKSLAILPESERNQVIHEWNQTQASFPQGTIDGLFALQVQRTPNEVAVVAQDGAATSYTELDRQSTLLARQLVANGVNPGDVVGVRIQRSTETIIALMAILKAGGVYLPLDPAYPPERLSYMISNADAKLVLESIAGLEGEADLPCLTDPSRPAYIIYTSGTTGQPKGVLVPHQAAVNLLFARQASYSPLNVGDRVLAVTSISFDVSFGQLTFPLMVGATVVISGDLNTLGAAALWETVSQQRVTHMNVVPSLAEILLDALPPIVPPNLKMLALGGEALSGSLVSRVRRSLPGLKLVNAYGPTETCIDATFHIATDDDINSAVLPIGRPLANYRCYVLDGRLEPVAAGIPGELYIGGACLADGYIKAPELTAERFIPDPFSSVPGARMYRTGDRAQWRADGVIEFLGRADKQVKIRGFRIELGEIEAALLLHPAIARAAVAADKGPSGQTRLIAYLVPQAGATAPEAAQLREHLAPHLPDYMIPAAFCMLETLPLTANGKLDSKALPKVAAERSAEVVFEAPRTSVEIALQQIWQQVLGVQPIGIHDNFFDLGGQSLAIMRMINACNTHFKTNLSLATVFENPTIAQLAAAVQNVAPKSNLHPAIVEMKKGNPSKVPVFFFHPAGGHILGYSHVVAEMDDDQPVYGIQNPALFPGIPLAASIEEMATDYITAIRSVQPQGPYQLIGRSAGGLLAYEIALQLQRQGVAVSFLCLFDTVVPDGIVQAVSEMEMLKGFGINFGLGSLFEGPGPHPANTAELFERAPAIRPEFQLIDLPQFDRFHAVWCKMAFSIYPIYKPKPWSGPFVLLRALKRLGPKATQEPHEWSAFVSSDAQIIDFDCDHDDFAEPWMGPIVAQHLDRLLAQAAAASPQPARHNPLIPLHPSGVKQNLFCVHPAGGRAFCYLPLMRELGPDQPVYGLQASGLHQNEPLPQSIQEMAADYLTAIRRTQPKGPYQVLGMSSGGVIALEIAQQLRAAGEDVSLLALLDTSLPEALGNLSPGELLQAMTYELNCADLLNDSPSSLAEVVSIAIKSGRLPEGFTAAEAERISAVFQAVVRSHAAYQPQPWSGTTVLLRATQRDKQHAAPPDWSPYFPNLRVNDIDANHYDLVTTAFAPTVAALLRPYLK